MSVYLLEVLYPITPQKLLCLYISTINAVTMGKSEAQKRRSKKHAAQRVSDPFIYFLLLPSFLPSCFVLLTVFKRRLRQQAAANALAGGPVASAPTAPVGAASLNSPAPPAVPGAVTSKYPAHTIHACGLVWTPAGSLDT